LPAAWRTLYELTKLTDEQVADGIKTLFSRPITGLMKAVRALEPGHSSG
jgi:hypothetical protein